MNKFKIKIPKLVITLFILTCLDVFTTFVGLRLGLQEINPLQKEWVNSIFSLFLCKTSLVFLCWFMYEKLNKIKEKVFILLIPNLLLLYAVINNIYLILKR